MEENVEKWLWRMGFRVNMDGLFAKRFGRGGDAVTLFFFPDLKERGWFAGISIRDKGQRYAVDVGLYRSIADMGRLVEAIRAGH